ncbi:MAG TPA: hypothetical protein DCS83_04355 [Prevotella sp.]|mgnify:FL=1|nr:hypothetical protein [Prevotella sp.]
MNKILYAIISVLTLASCAESYNITGTSNVSTLDGRKLYLKVLKDTDFINVDSCDVVHGQFHFSGNVDSAKMANIFMDNENVLPLVLEDGDITVKIDDTQQIASGTPLNDKLFKFFRKYNQLKNEESELVHLHDQAIMNGRNMVAVNQHLNNEAARITAQEDKLVTSFICSNFNNVLGPGIFFLVTIGYEYPQITPWIEDIMTQATNKFKNDPYVKDYYSKAKENEEIMNGMKDPNATSPAPPSGIGQGLAPGGRTPTPNELAQPAQQSDPSGAQSAR